MALRFLTSSLVRQTGTLVRAARLSTTTLFKVGHIPTDLDIATGVERKELEAILKGNPDPFNLNVKHGAPGTKESPTLVPSMFEERLIGCVCEEDSTSITWMVLKKGPSQRCGCGNFYQLVPGKTNALED